MEQSDQRSAAAVSGFSGRALAWFPTRVCPHASKMNTLSYYTINMIVPGMIAFIVYSTLWYLFTFAPHGTGFQSVPDTISAGYNQTRYNLLLILSRQELSAQNIPQDIRSVLSRCFPLRLAHATYSTPHSAVKMFFIHIHDAMTCTTGRCFGSKHAVVS